MRCIVGLRAVSQLQPRLFRVLDPLTRLGFNALAEVQVDDALLRLYLPALRQATLCGWDRTVGTLRVDRDSFAAAPQLEDLSLGRLGVMTLMPDARA